MTGLNKTKSAIRIEFYLFTGINYFTRSFKSNWYTFKIAQPCLFSISTLDKLGS